MQLMNDELSALVRTNFSSLKLLIAGGVCVDGHPPLVQVFLFYWIKIFGNTEIAVRFPFIVAGIVSIYFVYKIGRLWFNPTTGLVAAAFVSTLQYTIFYSQLARPYVSGLLLSLVMVWCWTNFIFNTPEKKTKWLVGFVLSSTLCAYNHHFSLLFAFVVGCTGLFFVNKNTFKLYLLGGFSILLLYLPNLPIFSAQLKMGGIGGWLAPPTSSFFINYISYIFHFSKFLYCFVALLIVGSIFLFVSFKSKNKPQINSIGLVKAKSNTFRIISFFWFVIPIIIGYCYSVFVNPVLQYSMLIFSFPFFLFFIFSLFIDLFNQLKVALILSIIGINIYTLVAERHHYNIFNKQPHEQFVKDTFSALDSIGSESDFTICANYAPRYIDYYYKKFNRKLKYIYFDNSNFKPDILNFKKLIEALNTNYFIINDFNQDYVAIVKEKYPYLIKKNSGFTYDFYCFSKIKPAKMLQENILFSTENNFETELPGWSVDLNKVILDSNNFAINNVKTKYLMVDSLTEYAATFEKNLNEITKNKYTEIHAQISILKMDSTEYFQIVISLESGEKVLFWRSANGADYNPNNGLEFTAHLNISLRDQNFDYSQGNILKIYLWNKEKSNFIVTKFKIEFVKINPLIYGLYEKIPTD